jgi:hypothetical protein
VTGVDASDFAAAVRDLSARVEALAVRVDALGERSPVVVSTVARKARKGRPSQAV